MLVSFCCRCRVLPGLAVSRLTLAFFLRVACVSFCLNYQPISPSASRMSQCNYSLHYMMPLSSTLHYVLGEEDKLISWLTRRHLRRLPHSYSRHGESGDRPFQNVISHKHCMRWRLFKQSWLMDHFSLRGFMFKIINLTLLALLTKSAVPKTVRHSWYSGVYFN